MKEPASLRLLDPLVLHYEIKKLTPTRILHDQVQLLRSLYYFIQLNDMRMSDEFEDVDLSGYTFNITDILDLLFLKDLNSNLLPSQVMIA